VAPDRRKAIAALRHAVELDSTNYDAANSLAVTLAETRDYTGADQMYHVALASAPSNGTLLTNLALLYIHSGRHKSFDSVMAVLASRGVPFPTVGPRYSEYWNRHDYDADEQLARKYADTSTDAQYALADLAQLHGRLREAEQRHTQAEAANARLHADTASPYLVAYDEAVVDASVRGHAARGVAVLDAASRAVPVATVPLSGNANLFWLAAGYARAGAPAKARDVMSRYESRMDSVDRREQVVNIVRLHGLIALAEGKTDSAVADFRRGDNEADGLPTFNCVVCTPLYLGLAFDRGGRSDSARTYLTRYVEMTAPGRWVVDKAALGPVLFRLGELDESAGDAAHAAEYYGRFVDLWAHADPELQPRVAEARARIAQLDRATR